MSKAVSIRLQVPDDTEQFRLPPAVDQRLHFLLDRQDDDTPLTTAEREEAQGLVDMAEMLSLIRIKAKRAEVA